MKISRKITFFIVVLFIFAFSALTAFGLKTYNGDIETIRIRGLGQIRWGIDIRGGVDAIFEPDVSSDPNDPAYKEITDEQVDAAKSVIETRLIKLGVTDYEVYPDYRGQKIVVRFPWKENDSSFDPAAAVKELGEMTQLAFREGSPYDQNNENYQNTDPDAFPVILTGDDVKKADSGYDSSSGEYIVRLEFNPSGTEEFAEATGRLLNDYISIWLDETLISAPSVNAKITDGTAIISGSFTAETAKDLSDKINGGALPYKLKNTGANTISPTLGESAKDVMILAGVIAFAFITVFMICIYRLTGVVAVIGLLGQVFGSLAVITGFFPILDSFTLTIPGIAGIILSIGMGVDANVITSERIKEELRSGKSLDGALVAGYNRAFTAIFDGNITLMIVAFVLMGAFAAPNTIPEVIMRPFFFMFGTSAAGSIYSFGFTLIVGSVFNFIFGVGAAKMMTMSLSRFKILRKPWLYNGYSKKQLAEIRAAKASVNKKTEDAV